MRVAQLAVNKYSSLWSSKQITQIYTYIQDYKRTAEYECKKAKMRDKLKIKWQSFNYFSVIVVYW